MCGRFLLISSTDEIAQTFGVDTHANIPERYNIAPTQPVLIVRQSERGSRGLASVEWGLVPEWAKELRRDNPMINARVETVVEKPSFRSPMKRTRCLVPSNGWYEWKASGGAKQPWLLETISNAPFAFAGIWTTWHGTDGESWLETMAILTAPATGPLRAVHGRRPLVVRRDQYDAWMTPHDPLPRDFIEHFNWVEETEFKMKKVSRHVNNVRNDDFGCIAPPEEDKQGSLF